MTTAEKAGRFAARILVFVAVILGFNMFLLGLNYFAGKSAEYIGVGFILGIASAMMWDSIGKEEKK